MVSNCIVEKSYAKGIQVASVVSFITCDVNLALLLVTVLGYVWKGCSFGTLTLLNAVAMQVY